VKGGVTIRTALDSNMNLTLLLSAGGVAVPIGNGGPPGRLVCSYASMGGQQLPDESLVAARCREDGLVV